jgi:putative flippase GtrA
MTALFATRIPTPRTETIRQLATFGAIGVTSTLAYLALYAWLRQSVSAGAANAVALVLTAVGNTAANRRLTFEVRGRSGLARDHVAGLVALAVALLITSASLGLLDLLAPSHGRTIELAVLLGGSAAATVARFALLRLALRAGRQPVPFSSRIHR